MTPPEAALRDSEPLDPNRCSTCGGDLYEADCHLSGNHDDAFQIGVERGYEDGAKAEQALIVAFLEECGKGGYVPGILNAIAKGEHRANA